MKTLLLFVVLIAVLATVTPAALAQQPQTGTMITVSFTPSVSPTAVASDILGASGPCPATGVPASATVLGTVLRTATPNNSYDFKLGTPGTVYCLFTKAKDAQGNTSVASNTSQATFPFPTVLPDTNVVANPK